MQTYTLIQAHVDPRGAYPAWHAGMLRKGQLAQSAKLHLLTWQKRLLAVMTVWTDLRPHLTRTIRAQGVEGKPLHLSVMVCIIVTL